MAKIALLRIDSRLIHGQVVSAWVKVTQAKRIIIIDDWCANDALSAQIFAMAAPPAVKVEVMTVEDAVNGWKKDQFGNVGPILVLFKTVAGAYRSYQQGLAFDALQVGGIPGGPGRIAVEGTIALNQEDASMLQQLSQSGVHITFQLTTDTKVREWKAIQEKHFPKL